MTQAEEPRLERVVVLEGGISSEREVSLLSGRGVKEALASKGLEVESWDPAVDSVGGLEEGAYDAAFIALHGTLGEDGSVQGLLNCIGLPYTGPGVTASAIAMDKELTKNIWRANGISVPAGVRLTAAASDAEFERAIAEFGADGVVVKPGHDGSSIGVTKLDRDALSLHSLRAALNAAAERDAAEVLVEEYIHGREFTVAILDGKAGALSLYTENGWQGTVLCTELPGAEDAAAALKRCWQAAKPDAALPAGSRLELVCWDPAQNRKVQLPEE